MPLPPTLTAWLSAAYPDGLTLDAAARIDLSDVLAQTSAFPQPPSERLRQLGIFLEEDRALAALHGAAAWPALQRIHAEAVRLAPHDARTGSSLAAAALACAEVEGDARLLDVAHALQAQTVERFPHDATAARLLGRIHHARPHELPQAIAAYRLALHLDPADGWARLHLAHALHDAERWAEAAEAYAAVPVEAFPEEHTAWRLFLAREQRADCLLHAGHRDEAVALFRDVLDRLEAALDRDADPVDDPALFAGPTHLLQEAAEGPLAAELGPRWQQVMARLHAR